MKHIDLTNTTNLVKMHTHKHIQKKIHTSYTYSICGRYAYNKMTTIPQNSNHPFPLPSVALIRPETTNIIKIKWPPDSKRINICLVAMFMPSILSYYELSYKINLEKFHMCKNDQSNTYRYEISTV